MSHNGGHGMSEQILVSGDIPRGIKIFDSQTGV